MKQTREVSGGSNFGCLPLEQHFGLAAHTKVDTIIIRWPSQQIQRFDNLEMNKTYEFTEGQDGWTDVYAEAKKKKLQGTAEESEKAPATHRRKRKAHEE
jgi:hypothetical protein